MDSKAAKSKTIFNPARNVDPDVIPWIPIGEGKSFKPLRFFKDARGFAELLRIEPGTVIPLHRHTGEIHAFNLEGTRELCTGEVIGPGDYVYEPSGNVDTWKAIGHVPCVIFVTVGGAVEFLAEDHTVERRVGCTELQETYRQYCEAHGLEMLDLID